MSTLSQGQLASKRQESLAIRASLAQFGWMQFDFRQALKDHGGVNALAAAIGVSHQAISQWRQVPPKRVLAVEAAWGVSRHVIRPDICGIDPGAASTPSVSDGPNRADGSFAVPNSEISESPVASRGAGDRAVTPASEGVA